jgi:hypothetical protein
VVGIPSKSKSSLAPLTHLSGDLGFKCLLYERNSSPVLAFFLSAPDDTNLIFPVLRLDVRSLTSHN